jgi:predicted RNA-binding protein with PUA-like domain
MSEDKRMSKWLVKSEPSVWSWDQQVAIGTTHWNGVRNAQALINMRAMAKGDLGFFYHSNEERQIVGIVEIARAFYPDTDDPKSVLVDVKAKKPMKTPVTLASIKAEPRLAHLALVRQSRLSVMPIDEDAWALILSMAGMK